MLFKIASQLITTRIFLNGMSCIMGFFAWYCISSSQTVVRTIHVPIYFDNVRADMHIDAPETTSITLAGTRNSIKTSSTMGAVHFDSAQYSTGKRLLHATYQNFLLPSAVKLLNCMPIEVSITTVEQHA